MQKGMVNIMKKLITALLAAMMLAACMGAAVFAEEFEKEIITALDGYYITNGNTMEVVTDNVDGVEQPVIKWQFTSSESDFGTQLFDALSSGTYRMSVKYKCPNNPGQGRFGIRNETIDGKITGFPSNAPAKQIVATESYITFSRDVIITNSDNQQYVRMRFGQGEAGYCYIAEYMLQRVNEDGTLGENLLPEFYQERIKGTTEGWATTNANAAIDIAYDTVNGVERPVLKLSYSSSESVLQWHFMDKFEKGDYQISVTYYSPKNPGSGRVGFRYDSSSNTFPTNTTEQFLTKNSGYETKTKVITSKEVAAQNQYLKMLCQYGDTGDLYIAEVKVQKVNEDGTLGENLITNSDFMVRKIPEPEKFEVSGLMFDVVDAFGGSLTGGAGIDVIPPYVEGYSLESSVGVSNNSGDNINPALIVAIYNNGTLYDVQYMSVELADASSSDIKVSVGIPDADASDSFTAKTFVWKNMSEMKPLSEVVSISSAE